MNDKPRNHGELGQPFARTKGDFGTFKEPKMMKLTDFLTPKEIEKAYKLYTNLQNTGTFAKRCSEEIIAPVIGRINKQLGQENSPEYLAYAVEYSFQQWFK